MRLIDADALGNRMYHEVFEKDTEDQRWDSGCWMRYKLFERVLREQPTIKPDVPDTNIGKWIEHNNGQWLCSECGQRCLETVMMEPRWKYCPNCGADLQENHLSKSQYKRIQAQREAKEEGEET